MSINLQIIKASVQEVLVDKSKVAKTSKTDKLLASISSHPEEAISNKSNNKNTKKTKPAISHQPKSTSQKIRASATSTNNVKINKAGLKDAKENLSSTVPPKKVVKIPKIEKDLSPLYSEMVSNIFERPLILTLLGPSYILSKNMGLSFFLK